MLCFLHPTAAQQDMTKCIPRAEAKNNLMKSVSIVTASKSQEYAESDFTSHSDVNTKSKQEDYN
jgi:hypothetical protein